MEIEAPKKKQNNILHRCRFVNYQPSGISALAFHQNGILLAIARDSGDIELINTDRWQIERKIVGSQTTLARGLTWIGDRLFSGGLVGRLVEWDLRTLSEKSNSNSYGGAIWAIAASHGGSFIAVACEEGSVRLFQVDENGFNYSRVIGRQEQGRVLSLAWSFNDQDIITGASDNTIRRWEVKSGRNVLSIDVEQTKRRKKKSNTLVWAVAVLRDMTIVSGDSLGNTSFWDGNTGTMLQLFTEHEADVVTLAVDPAETTVWSAGVDNVIKMFQLAPTGEVDYSGKRITKWATHLSSVREHTHDIKALAVSRTKNIIVSGGLDTTLQECSTWNFQSNNVRCFHSVPQKPIISTTYRSRRHDSMDIDTHPHLLLHQQVQSLSLWKLGEAHSADVAAAQEDLPNGAPLHVQKPHKQLLVIQPKSHKNIVASALSPDGTLLAFSDTTGVKLFGITYNAEAESVKLHKIKMPSLGKAFGHSLLFTYDSKKFIVATSDQNVHVFDVSTHVPALVHTFTNHNEQMQERTREPAPIVTLAASYDGKYLASGDLNNVIHLFNLEKLEHHCTLPTFEPLHTTFHFTFDNLLAVGVATSGMKFFDVGAQKYTEWTSKFFFGKEKSQVYKRKIFGFSFNPASPNVAIGWGNTFYLSFDLNDMYNKESYKLNDIDRGIMLYMGFLEENTVVMVERELKDIKEQLPPSLYRKRYAKS